MSHFNGQLLKDGTRPVYSGKNTPKDDVVIGLLAGIEGQIQVGIVNVNFYLSDVDNGSGSNVKDVTRFREVEKLIYEWLEGISSTEYWYELDGTPQTYKSEVGNQHFINVRLKYSRIIH